MWATAVRSPARLNVLLAEPSVTSRPRNRSSRIANGWCTEPGWTSSPQISSVITSRSCRSATSATAATSSSSNTRPVGLCGLQNRITRVVSSIAAASRSGEIRQPFGIERYVDTAPAAVGDGVEERVVDRREHHDAVAALGRVPQRRFEGVERTGERPKTLRRPGATDARVPASRRSAPPGRQRTARTRDHPGRGALAARRAPAPAGRSPCRRPRLRPPRGRASTT